MILSRDINAYLTSEIQWIWNFNKFHFQIYLLVLCPHQKNGKMSTSHVFILEVMNLSTNHIFSPPSSNKLKKKKPKLPFENCIN